MRSDRRKFLKQSGQYALGFGILGMSGTLYNCGGGQSQQQGASMAAQPNNMFFEISLAQWSLHKTLFGGQLDNLGFAAKARNDFGIGAVEYVNQFFKDHAKDSEYLDEMVKRSVDHDVRNVLIMIDGEGNLGAPDDKERLQAVENHYKWVEAAKHLGCHSIRVNAFGVGAAEEVQQAAIDALGRLGEFAAPYGINVIVENHGGYSSDGAWLVGVMRGVGMDNVGTLPDFGNFCIRREGPNFWEGKCVEEYDRYQGVAEMMPYAKGVSAKSHDFDEHGHEVHTDYARMLKIIKDAGYTGYIGIEYEGSVLSEDEGIRATKSLLERVGRALSETAEQ